MTVGNNGKGFEGRPAQLDRFIPTQGFDVVGIIGDRPKLIAARDFSESDPSVGAGILGAQGGEGFLHFRLGYTNDLNQTAKRQGRARGKQQTFDDRLDVIGFHRCPSASGKGSSGFEEETCPASYDIIGGHVSSYRQGGNDRAKGILLAHLDHPIADQFEDGQESHQDLQSG